MIDDAKTRFNRLKASGMLPSPQGVALAVLELTQRQDASIQDLTHLVQTDPAMAGRILRYANAVHGGSLRHIASPSHAIVFLGLFRVRQIALGFSLVDHYRSGACKAFDYLGYWTASLATGITAQQLAAQAQCPPDESFTCGLLSGIGRLALAHFEARTEPGAPDDDGGDGRDQGGGGLAEHPPSGRVARPAAGGFEAGRPGRLPVQRRDGASQGSGQESA